MELSDETASVIDHLVFCTSHSDEPIKFYCNDCDEAICITCQVVSHKTHNIVTVDDALKSMIPGIEEQLQLLAKKSLEVAGKLEKVEKQKIDIESKFHDAYKIIDKETEDRIEQLKRERDELKQRLAQDAEKQVHIKIVLFSDVINSITMST